MYSVEEIMAAPVVTINASATVREAALTMAKHHFGSLIVVPDGSSSMRVEDLGIVTERDILLKVVAQDKPTTLKVAEIMTKPLFSVEASDDVSSAADLMFERKIRRVPVTRDGIVVGIVSLRDANKMLRFSSAKGIMRHREEKYFRHG